MKILHISYAYDFSDGGITSVVEQLIREQKKINLSVDWIASSHFSNPLKRGDLIKKILEINPSIVHLHGLWRIHTRITNKLRRYKIPYIICPHGMLDKWALNQSNIKKKIAWQFWEREALEKSIFIHSLCESEFEGIKKINPTWKSYQITNGINIPEIKLLSQIGRPKSWDNKIPENSNVLLFMGRFHKKKGIEQLLSAWEIISQLEWSKNWWLCFTGSGDINIKKNLKKYKNIERIIITEPAFDEEKERILRNSSAFILNSFSEGLPMAVIEAMSFRLPCLISENCNLNKAIDQGAAIKSNPSIEEIVRSLQLFFKMKKDQRDNISNLAVEYVKNNHNWRDITLRTKKLYESIYQDNKFK
tara:strand:+ start:2068 stop:3150 length:1083 start_codon:yes stop_codon:yes gene_type:complete